jgi:hypothetical protein
MLGEQVMDAETIGERVTPVAAGIEVDFRTASAQRADASDRDINGVSCLDAPHPEGERA